jgi:DNA-binding GntR family transcriptional regulator
VDQGLVLTLDRAARPLHVAIAAELTEAIASGRLAPGARLPSERELAHTLGVSRMTVRQALGELERAGRLRRVVGRAGGTFVQAPQAAPVVSFRTLSGELRHRGRATALEPVSAIVEPAGKRAAAALDLKRSDRVVVVTRLRLAHGKPLAVERSSLPAGLFPDIEEMDLTGPLDELMARGLGIHPTRVIERLEVTEARPQDARALGVRRESPLILVERVRYTADGIPVEFGRDRFRPDRTHVVMEFTAVGD